MKVALALVCTFGMAVSAFSQTITGQLERIDSGRAGGALAYRCLAHGSTGVLKIDLTLDTKTSFLDVDLDNDVRVRGFASETTDRKTGTTYYFLQGGSAPVFQRLTLAIRDAGKWARFTKTYGADEFVCE